jgi:3-hydroxyacyl-[acyl-carrier-protein] dehydratase
VNLTPLTGGELIEILPQMAPFRFVDRVRAVDSTHILAEYRFREDEFYYPGHFPGQPITPGVVLLECMAQCGVTLHGLYLLALELHRSELSGRRTMLTNASVEWLASVYPGESVLVSGEVRTWRRQRIRSHVEMRKETGELVALGEIGGFGVRV